MKYSILFVVFLLGLGQILSLEHFTEDIEDNEFAEFEDFEEDEEVLTWRDKQGGEKNGFPNRQRQNVHEQFGLGDDGENEDGSMVEDEDSEFDHFQDDEEFEGFETGSSKSDDKEVPKITITKVPLHLTTNWDSYYLEMLMGAGLLVYFLNYLTGRSRNYKLANVWYYSHKSLLEENFSLVGDDGKMEIQNHGLMKESENMYSLWCSGRVCCEGMLVELKLLKRQDLLAIMVQMVRPTTDQIHIRVDMNKEDMDTFVFCLAARKTAIKLSKEMADLSAYCPEKKSAEKFGVPNNFSLMTEIGEVAPAMLDARVLYILNKYTDLIDYIHFSDQYSGLKTPDDSSVTKLPEVKKVLIFQFNMPIKGGRTQEAMEDMKVLLQLVFYCIDKVKRYRLSREGKSKADKNRLKMEEAFLKTTHAARAEAAAARREEKKRQEKERILQEDDPEKQRKWEEKEMKRQMKRKTPKMKQLKVKAL